MKALKFTKAHEKILHEQAIDADRPGPVLRDFRMVLDFIGPQGVKAAGKYNLLSLDAIAELPVLLGQSITLVYDFGDNWRFDVKLEAIEPPGAKIKTPMILEEHGRAPEQYPNWDE